jgi:hypothetical protein
MRTALLSLSLLAVTVSTSLSATFFSSALEDGNGDGTDRLIATSAGIRLTSGYAGSGIFSLTDSEVAQLAAARDFSALFASFQAIGGTDNFIQGNLANLGFPVAGSYFISQEGVVVTPAEVGASLYTLIFNSSSAASATEFALLKSTQNLQADAASPAVPNFYSNFASEMAVVAGMAGPTFLATDLSSNPTPTGSIQLVVIPEPSCFALAAAGLTLAVGARRRR